MHIRPQVTQLANHGSSLPTGFNSWATATAACLATEPQLWCCATSESTRNKNNANQKQPTAADLLCYYAVHIPGLVTGHEVDWCGTNNISAQSSVVLETITGAVLKERGREGEERLKSGDVKEERTQTDLQRERVQHREGGHRWTQQRSDDLIWASLIDNSLQG